MKRLRSLSDWAPKHVDKYWAEEDIHVKFSGWSTSARLFEMQRYLFTTFLTINSLFLALKYTPIVLATAISRSSLVERETVNCTSAHAALDATCWQTLNVTEWITGWEASIGTCKTDNEDDCCLSTEVWSTCFLRINQMASGSDCREINSNTCSFTPDLISTLKPNVTSEVHYVIQNIYGR